jgi:hypothetical protein
MKLTIDTKVDSHEDIRKAIRMLSSLVGDSVKESSPQKNIFDDDKPSDTPVFGNIFDDPKGSEEPSDVQDKTGSDKIEIVY